MSASWRHTPSGASGPITITVNQREGESPESFQQRVAEAVALFPPDPE